MKTAAGLTALLNGQQNFVARYVYDPFGNILSKSGPLADANVCRFSSQECHPNSGLVLYLYRPYDPNLQRFLNRDRIEERRGINLYGIVANAPLNWIDPDGLAPQLETVVFDFYTAKTTGYYGPDYKRVRPGSDSSGSGLPVMGASMVPGIGEAMDASVIADPESKWWEKGLAEASLCLNALTEGFLPNVGGLIKASKTCRVTGHALDALRKEFSKVKPKRWKHEATRNPSNYSPENLARMQQGKPPIGSDGYPMELHHKKPLAEGGDNSFNNLQPMTQTEHRRDGNYKINHPNLP